MKPNLSLLLPLLEKSLSVSPGLMGEVGEVGERGERGPPLQEGSRDGGSPGDRPAPIIYQHTIQPYSLERPSKIFSYILLKARTFLVLRHLNLISDIG
jgi:hypothetical protein